MNNIIKIREKLQILLNYMIILYAAVIPFQYYYSKKLVSIMFILWILTVDYKVIKNYLLNNRLFQLIIIFTIVIFSSYLWSNHYPGLYYGDINIFFTSYKSYFLLPIIIIITSLKQKYIKYIIISFMLSMYINELISYGIYFSFWTTPHGTPYDPVPFQISHITYSVFIAFTILLSIYKIFVENNNIKKTIYSIFFITMTISLFMSAGRTGQMALLLTLFTLIIMYFKNNLKQIILLFLSILLIFFVAYKNINTFNIRINHMINNIETVFIDGKNDTSFGTRLLAIHAIPYLINKDNFLYGVGIGNREEYVKNIIKNDYPYKIHNFLEYGRLHNMYIEILVSNGIIGLFLLLSIFYMLIFNKIKDKHISYLSKSIGLLIFYAGIPGDIFFFYEMMLLFSLFISIYIVQYNYERRHLDV